MDLTGKIALVTGASRGIGEAISITLAAAGATVIGTALTESSMHNITERLSALGNKKSVGRLLNVDDAGSIEALVESVSQEIGTIDILVNNAGITRDGLLMRMSEEDWDAIINTNLKSVFRSSKAVMRGMMKVRTGRIINIASIVGTMGNPGQTNYAASKAGMIGFTKSVALELGSRNIRCNAIAPGFIETEMTAKLSEDVVKGWREGIPLKRGGTPEDVANICVFLGSELSAYVSGQTIHVCGGMNM